ncbi:unnamed protein product [Linum tenue]|nr:unnamed protein product [Linum tenue]
MISGFEC